MLHVNVSPTLTCLKVAEGEVGKKEEEEKRSSSRCAELTVWWKCAVFSAGVEL